MPAPLVEAQKPRFHSPVWLDDIHSNKLFNKQRSILSEVHDYLEQTHFYRPPLLQATPPPPPALEDCDTPRRPPSCRPPIPIRSISEIIDSDSEEELPPPPPRPREDSVGQRIARATETDL